MEIIEKSRGDLCWEGTMSFNNNSEYSKTIGVDLKLIALAPY